MNKDQQQLHRWLQALGTSLGIELTLDQDGGTCIECEDNVQVFVEMPDDTPLVHFYAPMVRLPDDETQQNAVLKEALKINLFSLETGASCLAFDARTQSIALTFAVILVDLDEETFAEALGDFIEMSIGISKRLLAFSQLGVAHHHSSSPAFQRV